MWIRLIKASQIVYHGSPYKFDNFDLSKIGTNAGTELGWGIYLTKDDSFAKGYSDDKITYNNNKIPDSPQMKTLLQQVIEHNKNPNFKKQLEKDYYFKKTIPNYKEWLNNLDFNSIKTESGHVYKVQIPDDEYFIQYFSSFEQQSDFVKNKLTKIQKQYRFDPRYITNIQGKKIMITNNPKGEDYYYSLTKITGSSKEASKILKKYGIVGNMDGDEICVWDTSKIKILEVK